MAKIKVEPGDETERIDCEECHRAFAVILEPSYRHMNKEELRDQGGFKPVEITYCPFCGGEELEV